MTDLVYPDRLIIPVTDLVDTFLDDISDVGADLINTPHDLAEILTQIFQVLLNHRQHDCLARLAMLPEFNRMVNNDLLGELGRYHLQRAVPVLGAAIRERLIGMQAFQEDDFPYFFDRMIEKDVVLVRLPH